MNAFVERFYLPGVQLRLPPKFEKDNLRPVVYLCTCDENKK